MSVPIFTITEGHTELRAGLALWERQILDPSMEPKPGFQKKELPREGYENVLGGLLSRHGKGGLLQRLADGRSRVLLLFDQERLESPASRADAIADHFRDYGRRNGDAFWEAFEFKSSSQYENLFFHFSDKLKLTLHVADSPGLDGNRDFDGYILRLLQHSGKESIGNGLIQDETLVERLFRKAEREMPELMERNGFPILSSKSWLYFYIATFQRQMSHVWFAEEVVRHASEDALRDVFAPLVAAWDALAPGGSR
jgi:hypothetical protein